jgi:hypothetical protein
MPHTRKQHRSGNNSGQGIIQVREKFRSGNNSGQEIIQVRE